jgi:GNAT superfamily N-acetyltransferase
VWRALYHVHDDLVIRKDLREDARPAPAGPFRVERAGPQHQQLAARYNARRCYRRATLAFRERLQNGYTGLVALLDGEMVGHMWCIDASSHPDHPEVRRYAIDLADGEVYGFDFYLAEEHRGSGNATAFLDQVHAALRSLDYRVMWGYVESDNVASRWLFSIAGHAVVRRRRSLRILSRLLVVDRRIYLEGDGGMRPLLGR